MGDWYVLFCPLQTRDNIPQWETDMYYFVLCRHGTTFHSGRLICIILSLVDVGDWYVLFCPLQTRTTFHSGRLICIILSSVDADNIPQWETDMYYFVYYRHGQHSTVGDWYVLFCPLQTRTTFHSGRLICIILSSVDADNIPQWETDMYYFVLCRHGQHSTVGDWYVLFCPLQTRTTFHSGRLICIILSSVDTDNIPQWETDMYYFVLCRHGQHSTVGDWYVLFCPL